MKKFMWLLVSTVSSGAFSVLYAHPGGPHQHKLVSFLHFLTDPFHIIVALELISLASLMVWFYRGALRSNS